MMLWQNRGIKTRLSVYKIYLPKRISACITLVWQIYNHPQAFMQAMVMLEQASTL